MFTYQDAMEIIGNRTQKKVANNTYLVALPDSIGVRLHDTIVVQLYANGQVSFNSGGYQTSTTKNRMQRFSPFLFQQVTTNGEKVWSIWKYNQLVEKRQFVALYQDFMKLDHKGRKVA